MMAGVGYGLHHLALQRAATEAAVARVVEVSRQVIAERNRHSEQSHTLPGAVAQIERIQDALAQASSSTSGTDRLFLEEGRSILEGMKGPTRAYGTAYQQFKTAGGSKPASLTNAECVAERRRLLAECIRANDQLAEVVRGVEGKMRADLRQYGVSEDDINRFGNDYVESAHVGLGLRVREACHAEFQAIDALLEDFGRTWGQWHVDPQGTLVFDKHDEAVRYNGLFRAAGAAAAEVRTVQQQFIDAGNADQKRPTPP